jgi:hypothetical protein
VNNPKIGSKIIQTLNKMKKRRHHFVWKDYLTPWLIEGKIFTSQSEKVFNTNPINIGVQTDFYKLKELTPEDIAFIEIVFRNELAGNLGEANRGWLSSFQKAFRLRKSLKQAGISSRDIEDQIDLTIQNAEEDLHFEIESDASRLMAMLREKKCGFFLEQEDRVTFAYYLMNQYFRTKKIEEAWLSAFTDDVRFNKVNIRNCWAIGRHITSTQTAAGIFNNENFRLIPLINNTSISFITGDQPVLNTYTVGKWGREIPSGTQFYYPISPSFAILVSTESSSSAEVFLTKEQVWDYNLSIYDVHHEQLYANSAHILEECADRYNAREQRNGLSAL